MPSAESQEQVIKNDHTRVALQHTMFLEADTEILWQVPTLPRHLATPDLMERAGDPTFYDEPELARASPPAARHTPSEFAAEGCLASATVYIKSDV